MLVQEAAVNFLVVLVSVIVIWAAQTFLTRRVHVKYVYPIISRNGVTNRFIAWVAIASHEVLGHLAVNVFTGGRVLYEDVEIKSQKGHVTSMQEISLFGWFSQVFAALAPLFSPMFVVFMFMLAFAPVKFVFDWSSLSAIIASHAQNLPNLVIFLTDLRQPAAYLFLYALMTMSLTAAPSGKDLMNIVEGARRYPSVAIGLFMLIVIMYFSLAVSYDIEGALPLLWFVFMEFGMVVFGLLLAALFAFWVKRMTKTSVYGKMISFILFVVPYAGLVMAGVETPYAFAVGLLGCLIASVML